MAFVTGVVIPGHLGFPTFFILEFLGMVMANSHIKWEYGNATAM